MAKKTVSAAKRSVTVKEETTTHRTTVSSDAWKWFAVVAVILVAFTLYWAKTRVLEDKALMNQCLEYQRALDTSGTFHECSCRVTPKDAYDTDQGEVYNKTTRGCSCTCKLADGTTQSFDLRFAKPVSQ